MADRHELLLSRPDASKLILRKRFCRLHHCGALFFICSHCDRGHGYCSDRCREKSRRQQRRDANRRHQQSIEGRLDHRDRQRLYRGRNSRLTSSASFLASVAPELNPSNSFFVTDHGSSSTPDSCNISAPAPAAFVEPLRAELIACRICGRTALLVNPFEPE